MGNTLVNRDSITVILSQYGETCSYTTDNIRLTRQQMLEWFSWSVLPALGYEQVSYLEEVDSD
jgi:hypothetical protein